jgi:hypothetical protein
MFVEVLRWTETALLAGRKEWRLPKQENQSSIICLAQAVLSKLLALKCCCVLMPSFEGINASQLDNWHSRLSISKGTVSRIIRHLGYLTVCATWVLLSLTDEHKTERKAIPFELLACFEAEGDTFISRTATAEEPGSIILTSSSSAAMPFLQSRHLRAETNHTMNGSQTEVQKRAFQGYKCRALTLHMPASYWISCLFLIA